MKVILLQDVAKLGRKHTIVDVPDGYAANKLVPKGMAKPATPENVKATQAQATATAQGALAAAAAFDTVATKLKETPVSLLAEANAEGKLFEALKPEKIVTAVLAMTGQSVSGLQIQSAGPIKQIGTHTANLKLGSRTIPFTIIVTPTHHSL